MDFIIDTVGDEELQLKTELLDENVKHFIAMDMRLTVSPEQFTTIIEFMERYGDVSKVTAGPQGKATNERLWQKLTGMLNSMEGGIKKSTLKWKKVWLDWKAKTKMKYVILTQNGNYEETNSWNITPMRPALTQLEERVVAILQTAPDDPSMHGAVTQEEMIIPMQLKSEPADNEVNDPPPADPHDVPNNNNQNNQNDKEERTQAILALFNEKKQELDDRAAAEEQLEKKLNNLKIDSLFDDFFAEMSWVNSSIVSKKKKIKRRLFHFDQLDIETGKLKSNLGGVDVEKEMEKSVLKPGIEKEHRLPKYNVSEKRLKALRKKERQKTKGPGWFDMKAPEMTEDLKNDLNILKMRSALDPKHFYKKNDMEVLPKYFQVGTIMDSPLDHVNQRVTRKERKRTMVDELLADAEFQKYNKKKYKEIIDEKRKTEYRTFMKDKRQRNKAALKTNKVKPKKSVK